MDDSSPTVELRVAYSTRPPVPGRVRVETLSTGRRLRFALLWGLAVFVPGIVLAVLPLLHCCGFTLLVLGAPLASWWGWRSSVVTTLDQLLPCPSCQAEMSIPSGTRGWPLQANCGVCGARVGAHSVASVDQSARPRCPEPEGGPRRRARGL